MSFFGRVAAFALLQEPSQKLIDIDTAVTMLAIVMPRELLMPRFCEFLKEQTEYKVVNFDQWTSFLRFAQEVRPAVEVKLLSCPAALGSKVTVSFPWSIGFRGQY